MPVIVICKLHEDPAKTEEATLFTSIFNLLFSFPYNQTGIAVLYANTEETSFSPDASGSDVAVLVTNRHVKLQFLER